MKRFVLIAFGFSGASALIYEVVWTRALALTLGSTTYAMSTMLSAFMAGLALGGWLGGRIADRHKNLVLMFGAMEFLIGITGLMTIPLINSLSPVYFKIYKAFHLYESAFLIFQFFICAGVMLVPATLMGATFPVVSRFVTGSMDNVGRSVGNAYTLNTLGAIFGSSAAGFILIPLLGVRMSTIAAAVMNMTVGIVLIMASGFKPKKTALLIIIPAALAALWVGAAAEEEPWGVNYFIAGRYDSHGEFINSTKTDTILHNRDYREGRVKLWRDKSGSLIVQVGGKIEGTTEKDIPNAILLSYLPVASYKGAPQSLLNIGLGTGVTLATAKGLIKDITLVEINEGVVEALAKHGTLGLLSGIDVRINDARNYLLLNERKYDIISSEPSYPTDPMTGHLFTREFYGLASERLNSGGVFCQWLPYYLMTDRDMEMMLKTFGSVFDNVYLWKVEGSKDRIMVGSNAGFGFPPDEIIKRVIAMNNTGVPLLFSVSRGPNEIADMVGSPDAPFNTDDLPLLEFSVVKAFIRGRGI